MTLRLLRPPQPHAAAFLRYVFILWIGVATLCTAQQVKYKTYTAKAGETSATIAEKFDMTERYLLRLNPDVRDGVQSGDVLILPESNFNRSKTKKNYDYHTVTGKETLYSISIKYNVSQSELIRVNPQIEDGLIYPGQKLKLPHGATTAGAELSSTADNKYYLHTVQPKETIWRICYKLGISKDELYKHNPTLKQDGLKAGQTLKIPKSFVDPIENYYYHKVVYNEDLYGISLYYKVSQQRIKELNPALKYGLRSGMILKIPKKIKEQKILMSFVAPDYNETPDLPTPDTATTADTTPPASEAGDTQKTDRVPTNRDDVITYTEPKVPAVSQTSSVPITPRKESGIDYRTQTPSEYKDKSEITESYSSTYDQLQTASDPVVKQSLQSSIASYSRRSPAARTVPGGKQVSVAFMLPFYLDRYEAEGLKKTMNSARFAMYFYNGAMMAMEDLEKAGLRVRAKVYDTQNSLFRTKRIMQDNNFTSVDMVIGPLFTENAEYVSEYLRRRRTPVVSPLSKKHDLTGKGNLISVQVTEEEMQNQMIQSIYDRYQAQNIVLVSKYGNEQIAGYIRQQFEKKVKPENIRTLYSFGDNEPLALDSLANIYKDNWYVITDKDDNLSTQVINRLYSLKDTIVSSAFALNQSNIYNALEVEYLSAVNLHYPEPMYHDIKNESTLRFFQEYIRRFGGEPTKYALLGYDVTYDMLLKLANYDDFYRSLFEKRTEGISHRFLYKKDPKGGYYNTGTYVYSYDEDLDVVAE